MTIKINALKKRNIHNVICFVKQIEKNILNTCTVKYSNGNINQDSTGRFLTVKK